MNRINIMGVLAALALIMVPGFTAQAAVVVDPGGLVGGATPTGGGVTGGRSSIITPEAEVENDVAEVEDADVEDDDSEHEDSEHEDSEHDD